MFESLPRIHQSSSRQFSLIAGPCAIEDEYTAMSIAEQILESTQALDIPYVFKGSFKKANRSRIDSFTGIGDEKALKIIQKVGETFKVPTTTDIHEINHAQMAVSMLYVPNN